VLVLTVQLDELACELFECSSGHERAVDEGAAPPLRGHLTTNHDFVIAALEDGLDCRDIFTSPNKLRRGATTEQKPDGPHENRLAGSGFARQDVESRLELDIDGVDDREAGNPQEAKH
jgi:hypothetical protein